MRHSAELLRQCQALNFVGFVEGDRIFSGECDVIVCDGFVGNVALKTAEGVVRMMAQLAGYPRKKQFSWSYRRIYVQTAFFLPEPRPV